MGDSYDHALSAGRREGAGRSDRHRQCVDVEYSQYVNLDQTQSVDGTRERMCLFLWTNYSMLI